MITQDEIKRRFYCDSDGTIRWKISPVNGVNVGDIAGGKDKKGRTCYRRTSINNVLLYVHRIAWVLYYGKWPDNEIDHIDGNGLNNAIENLRDVTRSENHKNMRLKKNNPSGFNGIRQRESKKWIAEIVVNGETIHLGTYETREEAKNIRQQANILYGFHPNHGRAT